MKNLIVDLTAIFCQCPFEPPCFTPDFFFDSGVLSIVQGVMDERAAADQWGCDVPLRGSQRQEAHVDLSAPVVCRNPGPGAASILLVVSFGLVRIASAHGPIEIAPCTHRMPRDEAERAVQSSEIEMQPVPLEIGDVLIRHPWALHRGTSNKTDTRALATIRYVRRWYADNSREINSILRRSLTSAQQGMMRFPVGE